MNAAMYLAGRYLRSGRRAFRAGWRYARWGLVAVLVPTVIAIQVAIIAVLAFPFDPADLTVTSEPLVLFDLRGEEIATYPAHGADRTRWTNLGELPAIAVSAVIESEDENFWRHRGVDGQGIARAAWLDLQGGRYGGSTLTMQLARMLITANERRSVSAKVRESLLALRIERAVDKRTILEQWMNRAYFGNGVYGYAAASQLYFGKPPSALSNAEATLLAVIPRAPTGYDPLVHLDAALGRRDRVLALLVTRGVITDEVVRDIRATQVAVGRHAPKNQAPHFARWIRDQLPAHVRRAGGAVHTTLDLRLQRLMQLRVSEQVAALRRRNVDQAGAIVLDTQTTEVRAMVGSVDWNGPGGQINITTRRRHPGSALKPFVYATAIERGESPVSIAWDVQDTSASYYSPSTIEHGPVRYREALASSYNFAAIDVLEQVGVPHVMSVLRKAGVADVAGAPDDYGLRLALGAAKVRLLDLTASYGFTVKDGFVGTPRGITTAVLPDGQRWAPLRISERRVFSPETSWMVMDMLADPEARRPGFGMELPFDHLPFRVATKTGTARGFADTWAIAATEQYLVGTWAGTFDGTPMQGIVGMDAAAPLARDALLAVAERTRLTLPGRPAGVEPIEVCASSGLLPSATCPRISDFAARGRGPKLVDTWHDADGNVHYPARADGWLSRRRFAAR